MDFRPPSAEKMDFDAIHSREPKFQFLSPSLFLAFTMPRPAFEPFLRLPRGGCHTLFMRGIIPSFAAQNSPLTPGLNQSREPKYQLPSPSPFQANTMPRPAGEPSHRPPRVRNSRSVPSATPVPPS